MVNESDVGNDYFEAYEDLEVHRLMLEDKVRNETYKKAIFANTEKIKDKIVLDVGAGTGILSVFCAQAGAAKVYAVEASELYQLAEEVIKENGFENIIEVIHCKVEDLQLPNNSQVDVLISEWMGFYLLHEGMLDSVLFARDKFLKEDGCMLPESATIYCAPCSIPSMYDFWSNVNGVQMQCVGKRYRTTKSSKPQIQTVTAQDLLSEPSTICWLNLRDVTSEELDTIYHQDVVTCIKSAHYQGLCLWFECRFPSEITLSTSPAEVKTHWQQTLIVLPIDLELEASAPIAFELYIRRAKNDTRKYDIEMIMLDPDDVTHPEPCSCYMTKCILIKKMIEKYESEETK